MLKASTFNNEVVGLDRMWPSNIVGHMYVYSASSCVEMWSLPSNEQLLN
jgi:hypothetical protein